VSIPASNLVNVIPGVVGAGGNPLKFTGVILSTNPDVAAGPPISFPNYASVAAFFGSNSIEAKMAQIYFLGYNGATQVPASLLFARYPEVAIAAFLLGGPAATLATLKTFTSGSLSITVDGSVSAISSIDLSTEASLASIATDLTTALSLPLATISYDSTINAFICTSNTTGALSTITFATGTMAAALGFTQDTGGTLSQGAAMTDPTTFMNALVNYTQNWVSFATTFLPDSADMEAFSEWASGSRGRYMYVGWDNDPTAAETSGTFTGFGKWLADNQPNGTAAVWAGAAPNVIDGPELAAFVLGVTAAINFNALNGRISYAFKGNPNLLLKVTDPVTAANLQDNGYSFYGDYATADQQFLLFYNGQISGNNLWIDEYVDAIWLNNALQLSLMELFAQVNSLPYNTEGYSMIAAAAQGPITQALQNGVIRTGVALSPLQLSLVNSQAGLDISSPLQNNGYFFQVVPVTDPTVRGQRLSPACNLWYTDGGSIQQIVLNSIDIQ
jgi:hypothetical protein